MKVSILLPSYNSSLYLRDTLDSILVQTFTDYEVLLIDDGSTDETPLIALEYCNRDSRFKYYKNEINLGLIRTLNRGLSLASGDYIVRMDSDDVMVNNRLELQVNYMDNHPDCIVSGGQMRYIGDIVGYAPTLPCAYEDLFLWSLTMCPIYHPTAIIRKDALIELGLQYNESYKHAEDYKLWLDILSSRTYKIENINEILLFYRISKDQITSKYRSDQESVAKLVRKEFVAAILKEYGVCLANEIDIHAINKVASLIKQGNENKVLLHILLMLYMSINDHRIRLRTFISSKDFMLFCNSFSNIKLGLCVLMSPLFKSRGNRFRI